MAQVRQHANARLTPRQRRAMVDVLVVEAWSVAAIARHAVDQLTLNERATAAVERSQAARAIARHSRTITRRRGGTWSVDSVDEPTRVANALAACARGIDFLMTGTCPVSTVLVALQ